MGGLFILVADLDVENVVKTVIQRMVARNLIQQPPYLLERHPNKDGGCFSGGPEFILDTASQRDYHYVLILFDKEGCGKESWTTAQIEKDLIDRLIRQGWQANNVACIVLDPEIENWIWTESPHTSDAMGWGTNLQILKNWLKENKKHLWGENGKPIRPKEALEDAIAEANKKGRRIYFGEVHRTIAQNASLERCTDPSFLHFKETLLRWFPPDA